MSKRPALGKGIGALISSATMEGRHKYFLCPVEEFVITSYSIHYTKLYDNSSTGQRKYL